MKLYSKNFISLIILVVLTLTSSPLYADNLSGKTYYTKANVWYEHPNRILSTNYHRGAILPIGTTVKIHSIKGEKIQFTPDGSAQMFTLINDNKTSTISTDELFNRYFSVEAVQAGVGDYYQATEADRENIKNGIITLGMSKKAVLMAYGYPPTHKTPLLTSDIWYYWYSRPSEVNVYFKDDKVFQIERIDPAPLFKVSRSKVNSEGGIKSGNKTKE